MKYLIETKENENTTFITSFASDDFETIAGRIFTRGFENDFDIYENGKWIGNQDDANILEYYGYKLTPENIKNKLITIQ